MPWICLARIFLGNLSITSKVETCHHIHICIPNVSHKPFCYHHFYEKFFTLFLNILQCRNTTIPRPTHISNPGKIVLCKSHVSGTILMTQLKYYSSTVTHDKIFVYNFCVLWITVLQDAKVINENFIMCNGGWIRL